MSRGVEDAGSPEDAWATAVLAHEGALSVEQARQVLCLSGGAARDADAAKAAFRRLSIKWHPDKHSGEDAKARATALFVRIAAAYHSLTTTNFDYARCVSCAALAADPASQATPSRCGRARTPRWQAGCPLRSCPPSDTPAAWPPDSWSSSFQIPPMQTLEDVLLLAMKGEDPFVVDALLRKRGDNRHYRRE